jgi:hypothetical protein
MGASVMKIKLMWIGSAALGMAAALALRLTVHSAPLPPTHPAVINARISDAQAALNHRGDQPRCRSVQAASAREAGAGTSRATVGTRSCISRWGMFP